MHTFGYKLSSAYPLHVRARRLILEASRSARILVLSPTVPFPPVGGGNLRTYHLLRALADHHELTMLGFTLPGVALPDPPFPIQVVGVPWEEPERYRRMSSGGDGWKEAFHELAQDRYPWFVSFYDVPQMREAVARLSSEQWHLCLIEHSAMAQYRSLLPGGVPTILNLHDVHAWMAQRDAQRFAGEDRRVAEQEAARTVAFETAACAEADLCIVCSRQEALAAERLLGARHIAIVPNGVDTKHFRPCGRPPTAGHVLFTGMMNYQPNVIAVQCFVHEILPVIQRHLPNVTLHIVGASPTEAVVALASDCVVVHGTVPDTGAYFCAAHAVVVPLLSGGGTRVKILEAAAAGKAIVSTSLGMEGLDFVHGSDLLVADSPDDFARAVIEVLTNSARRQQLELNARRVALASDWQVVTSTFRQIADNYANV